MYSISPTMVMEGQQKFKTWWGAFFSLLAILAFGYYAFYKGWYFYYNNSTHLIENKMIQNHQTELGQKI